MTVNHARPRGDAPPRGGGFGSRDGGFRGGRDGGDGGFRGGRDNSCRDFAQGRCTRGESCRFEHSGGFVPVITFRGDSPFVDLLFYLSAPVSFGYAVPAVVAVVSAAALLPVATDIKSFPSAFVCCMQSCSHIQPPAVFALSVITRSHYIHAVLPTSQS